MYQVRIKGPRVEVSRYDGEPDYSAEIQKTFERFQQGAVKDYRVKYRGWPGMNHVGAQILDLVARLFSEEFSALGDYCRRHAGFVDPTIRQFDRELQFYLAYLDYIRPLRSAGLRFCYPELTADSKEIFAADTFDLALAAKLTGSGKAVVTNEFHLSDPERIIVVSGSEPGRQDDIRPDLRPAAPPGRHRLPRSRQCCPPLRVRPDLHPFRAGRGHR